MHLAFVCQTSDIQGLIEPKLSSLKDGDIYRVAMIIIVVV